MALSYSPPRAATPEQSAKPASPETKFAVRSRSVLHAFVPAPPPWSLLGNPPNFVETAGIRASANPSTTRPSCISQCQQGRFRGAFRRRPAFTARRSGVAGPPIAVLDRVWLKIRVEPSIPRGTPDSTNSSRAPKTSIRQLQNNLTWARLMVVCTDRASRPSRELRLFTITEWVCGERDDEFAGRGRRKRIFLRQAFRFRLGARRSAGKR